MEGEKREEELKFLKLQKENMAKFLEAVRNEFAASFWLLFSLFVNTNIIWVGSLGGWEHQGDLFVYFEVAAKDKGGSDYETEPGQVDSLSFMFHPFGEFDEGYLKEYECQEEGSDYSKDDC